MTRMLFKPISRLRRCHWLTWSIMFVVLIALVLIVVAGESSYAHFGVGDTPWADRSRELHRATYEEHARNYRSPSISSGVTVFIYDHGWPRPFLARALVDKELPTGPYRVRSTPLLKMQSWFQQWGGSTYIPVSWSNYDSWPFAADDWICDPWALLLDLVAALTILIPVGAATQWWSSGRKAWFSFRLSDLLGAVTVIGVLLAIYAHHASARRREGLATWPLRPPGFYVHGYAMTASQSYCGPDWLRKLAGSEYFPQLFHHITSASVQTNDSWRECYGELPKYAYLETLFIEVPLPIEAISQLERCKSLKHLGMPPFSSKRKTPTPVPPAPTFGVDDLGMLGRLRLESISLSGNEVFARHVEQVAGFPTLRRITLVRSSAQEEEIEASRRKHPTVTIVIPRDWESVFGSNE